MPVWIASLLTPILTGSASKIVRIALYGIAGIALLLFLYSALIKPTTAQRTVVQSGGIVNHYWEGSRVTSISLFGGCQDLKAEELMKAKNDSRARGNIN